MDTPEEDESRYLAQFGRAVVAWNKAEYELRQFLARLCSGPSIEEQLRARIVTAELGAVGIKDSLNAFVADVLPPDIGERVKAGVLYWDTLRGYRNHYVHGLIAIVTAVPEPVGILSSIKAKGRVTWTTDMIDVSRLKWLEEESTKLWGFLAALSAYCFQNVLPAGSAPQQLPGAPVIPPSLQIVRQQYVRPPPS